MRLRQFNQQGIEAFRQFLVECRHTPTTPMPTALLEDDSLTEPVRPNIEVEPRRLIQQNEAAEFLRQTLAPIPDHEVDAADGLWTWLSLYFFESVCPKKSGLREVKNDYHFIFKHNDSRHYYRHLLYLCWRVVAISPTHNRLLLAGQVSRQNRLTHEIIKRLFLTRIPSMFEVLDLLYWDLDRAAPKRGVVNFNKVSAGDLVHRLPTVIRQLEKTYDLQSLSADQLIELLGKEFQPPQAEPMALAS